MQLIPWSHECAEGFTLRGWRTPVSGKPLLHFLHGNGFCCLAYQPLLMRLGEHFDLWLCDVQGHGDSDHGGVFRGWNRTAELAVEAFQAGRGEYGDVPRFAVGHSFGGVLTGLILAAEPELFERAVLLDPVLFSRRMLGVMGAAALVGLHQRHALARKAASRRSHWPDREAALALLQGRGIFKAGPMQRCRLMSNTPSAIVAMQWCSSAGPAGKWKSSVHSPNACGRALQRSARRHGFCMANRRIPSCHIR